MKMMGGRLSLRRVFGCTIAVVVLALGALHLRYPLPYVYAVMTDQGPDYDDIFQFPASSIAASDAPIELTGAIDPRVAEIIEQHPDVERLEVMLETTETTAFLVMHQGRLVEERYLLGHDQESLQNSFSVSKSSCPP